MSPEYVATVENIKFALLFAKHCSSPQNCHNSNPHSDSTRKHSCADGRAHSYSFRGRLLATHDRNTPSTISRFQNLTSDVVR